MSRERTEWTILGRKIGTATGWDQADTLIMQVYDFEPSEGVDLPTSDCIMFDFEHGTAETYDDAGNTLVSKDLVAALAGLPVV